MPDHIYAANEKLKAIERELKYRRRVYARRVSEQKMSQALADEQIAIFEAIRSDYVSAAAKDRLL